MYWLMWHTFDSILCKTTFSFIQIILSILIGYFRCSLFFLLFFLLFYPNWRNAGVRARDRAYERGVQGVHRTRARAQRARKSSGCRVKFWTKFERETKIEWRPFFRSSPNFGQKIGPNLNEDFFFVFFAPRLILGARHRSSYSLENFLSEALGRDEQN